MRGESTELVPHRGYGTAYLDIARPLLDWGLECFPGIGKRPAVHEGLFEHGHNSATSDLGVHLEAAKRMERLHNVLIRPPAGMMVLDVDLRDDGHVHLGALCEKHGQLPETLLGQSGTGGPHIWLRATGEFKADLCPGVNIKTHKGYVVGPGSVHPDTGQPYRWAGIHPVAHAPRWVLDLSRKPARKPKGFWSTAASRNGRGDGSALVRTVQNAPKGERDSLLLWAACRAIEQGLFDTLRPQLEDAAAQAGQTPYEIARAMRSALKLNGITR
ncbi:bifunctional DNA primase/polymerase [Rhodococcus aetherivorans]